VELLRHKNKTSITFCDWILGINSDHGVYLLGWEREKSTHLEKSVLADMWHESAALRKNVLFRNAITWVFLKTNISCLEIVPL